MVLIARECRDSTTREYSCAALILDRKNAPLAFNSRFNARDVLFRRKLARDGARTL